MMIHEVLETVNDILMDPCRPIHYRSLTPYGEIAAMNPSDGLQRAYADYDETSRWKASDEHSYWEQILTRAERKFRFALMHYLVSAGDPAPIIKSELERAYAVNRTFMDSAAEIDSLAERLLVVSPLQRLGDP